MASRATNDVAIHTPYHQTRPRRINALLPEHPAPRRVPPSTRSPSVYARDLEPVAIARPLGYGHVTAAPCRAMAGARRGQTLLV
ncbi:MAG: hypothetical protein M5U09_18115 [Gammaproteobacteria bacterium]|nr:hypothetical protein [Gammaproteobacteria bacterium]